MPYKPYTKKYEYCANELITKCSVSKPANKLNSASEYMEFLALWDTGATHTFISPRVAMLLDLDTISKVAILHAGGRSFVETYEINLLLPNNVLLSSITVTETEPHGADLLIGMDIISQCDFSISNKDDKTTFSFRIPSYKETDFVAEYDEMKNDTLTS